MKNRFVAAVGSARWMAATGLALSLVATMGCELDDSAPLGPDEGGEAGSEAGSEAASDPLEISGTWVSDFGASETISDSTWSASYPTDDGTAPVVIEEAVVQFDNAANFAIVQASANDEFNPSKYGKKVWTERSGGTFYYCQVSFGQDSVAAAVASADDSDPNDLDGQGCQGFPWTKLSEVSAGGE